MRVGEQLVGAAEGEHGRREAECLARQRGPALLAHDAEEKVLAVRTPSIGESGGDRCKRGVYSIWRRRGVGELLVQALDEEVGQALDLLPGRTQLRVPDDDVDVPAEGLAAAVAERGTGQSTITSP